MLLLPSLINFLIFGSVAASVDDGDWKPFEFLSMDSMADRPSSSVPPTIKVQAVLSEGLGWEGQNPASLSNAFHVIVTVTDAAILNTEIIMRFFWKVESYCYKTLFGNNSKFD